MSVNVVDLRVAGPEADERLIFELEGLLAMAQSGELRSLMLCGFCADRALITYISGSDDRWRDLGAVERLKHRIHCLLDEDA